MDNKNNIDSTDIIENKDGVYSYNAFKGGQVVALKYQKGYHAPKVIAKGSGYTAERILDIAKENDILIHTDKNLAENLNKLDLGSDIPPELFEIVAQIYTFIDRIDSIIEGS
ncbi:MAG: EscU/YscU/HrcU family type III secretion system export apparatus switch protein [Oscillospiraceae bacterium]|nr:EscU/YscU/HrcU family type III secretion system export apparatus switch protein [Oscillospiraceae bacterium]